MFGQLSGARIKGGFFEEEQSFKLYETDKIKTDIVYGKNGSGKSSISKGIQELASDNLEEYEGVDIFSYDEATLNLSETMKKGIYVYNEKYISENLRLEEVGLNTIVMLGEQVGLDDIIKVQRKKLAKESKKYEEAINAVNMFSNDKEIISPLYYQKKIIEKLKNEGWAATDASIKGNKRNTSVNASTINVIYNNRPEQNQQEVEEKFRELNENYRKACNGTRVTASLKRPDYLIEVLRTVNGLLNRKINEPVVTNREKLIMSMLGDGHQKFVESSKKTFEKSHIEICPYCFQKVSETYKEELVASINQVLNKEVEEHINELKVKIIDDYVLDLETFLMVDDKLTVELTEKVKIINNELEIARKQVEEKIENIYTPITEFIDITTSINEINRLIDLLEEKRGKYNASIDEVSKIQSKLIKVTMKTEWFGIEELYKNMIKQQTKANEKEKEKNQLKIKVDNLEKQINDNEAKKSNISIALDRMNQYLEYIFFEKQRLSLQIKDGKYIILSRNKPILLKNLSLGERNAISLCYYFSQIQENCALIDAFSDQTFVVLDDPISSYDIENKVGIYSFLRYMISQIINANEKSKILIFTHKIESMYHLEKVCKDINIKYKTYNLYNRCLNNFNPHKHNEYSHLLLNIYTYASKSDGYEEYHTSIGNTMRRVLEAFGTFFYKQGIDKLSCNERVLELIKNSKQRTYFENLMYRLVLNTDSHYEEVARAVPEIDFFSHIDEDERIRTAKDILCFLYLLNSLHIEAHINNGTYIGNISQWCRALE